MKLYQQPVTYCEECPNCSIYDPDRDPYPDVGCACSEAFCKVEKRRISFQIKNVKIPIWCPLPDTGGW